MPEQRRQPRRQRQRQSCKDRTLLHAGHPPDKDAPESLTFHRPGLASQVPGTTYKPCSTTLPTVTFSPACLPRSLGSLLLLKYTTPAPRSPFSLQCPPPCPSISTVSVSHFIQVSTQICIPREPALNTVSNTALPSVHSLSPCPALFFAAFIIMCLCSLSGFHCPRLDYPRSRT